MAKDAASKATPRCPICREPTEARFRPFCSARCADIDLGRWLTGAYAVPGHADAEEDGEDARPPAGSKGGAPGRRGDDHADD